MVVPKELAKLELYAADSKFCEQWPELLPHWRETYPQLDILAEVRKAHEWEWIRPKYLRKRNRKSFLGKWLARAWYRLPPAERCKAPTNFERVAMIERIRRWRYAYLNGCKWEVHTHGLVLVSGHAPTGTRVWNSMACWELREVERADDDSGRVQEAQERQAEILPQPGEREDDGRRYF